MMIESGLGSQEEDPFDSKKNVRLDSLQNAYSHYQNDAVNKYPSNSETWLIELILRSDLKLTIDQIRTIIGINSENDTQMQVFDSLQSVIKALAKSLYEEFGNKSLLEYPLTDIKELLYDVARSFAPLFYVPVMESVPISSNIREIEQDTEEEGEQTEPEFDPGSEEGLNDLIRDFMSGAASELQENVQNQFERRLQELVRVVPFGQRQISNQNQNQNSQNQTQASDEDTGQNNKVQVVDIIRLRDRFHEMWILLVFIKLELDQI
ncbi:hypothetical protein DFJ63DRAFT_332885 [Scheffersomyces coipomensis]|uniref:uncharacterized protein n=1 Tax=Scheffersomyces coipomensis TaxID=1788519 RepID=UPI00315D20FE